jgi:hypothetical protein
MTRPEREAIIGPKISQEEEEDEDEPRTSAVSLPSEIARPAEL